MAMREATLKDVGGAPAPAGTEHTAKTAKGEKVLRHSLSVRVTHWMVAISGLVLLFTGFGELPMYKRYNVIKIPGFAWAGDFELNLVIHYIAAFFFSAGVVFHMMYHWRRREFAAMPRKGDGKESWHIIKAILLRRPEPPSGKFLAEQRLAYIAIGVTSLLLVVTGLLKVYKNLGNITFDPTVLQIITMAHTVAAMLFMMLFLAHLGAFVLKANWPLVPSMFTGRVKRSYAAHRHTLWDYDASDRGETVAEAKTRLASLASAADATVAPSDSSAPAGGAAASEGAGSDAASDCTHKVTVKDILRFVPGVMILASVALGFWVHPAWFGLSIFVAVNLIQSAITKWCLLETILRKLGVPECPCREAA